MRQIKIEAEKYMKGLVLNGDIALNYTDRDSIAIESILSGLIKSKGSLNCGVNSLEDDVILNFNNINGLIEISRYDNPIYEDVIPEITINSAKLFSANRNFEETLQKLKSDIVTIENILIDTVSQLLQQYTLDDLEFLQLTGLTFGYPVSNDKTPLLRITAVVDVDDSGATVIFKYATDVLTNMGFKNDGKRGSSLRIKR